MPRKLTKQPLLVAETLQDFLGLVSQVRVNWGFERDDVGGPWFRGHQRKHWGLLPNIIREGCGDRETEDEIREEFAVRAPALSRYETLPEKDWDFYFLMQHYGAPTRLLDWTESPVIALYFAVRDNPGYYDSCVWMLDPYQLNRRVAGKDDVISPSAPGANPKDIARVSRWLPSRWDKRKVLPDFPIGIFPTHIARRISSQRSCFTIHGRVDEGFSKFTKGLKPCLKKIVIPGYAVPDLHLAIRNYGVDDTTLFPDLEGLSRTLAASYRNKKKDLPHRGVYVRLRPSRIASGGVGVFAIKRIPIGTRIFAGENEEVFWMQKASVPATSPFRKLYDDFCIITKRHYGCPISFNRLTPAWFLNESKKPNARCDENYDFFALREIAAGKEITVDYETFSEYPGKAKSR